MEKDALAQAYLITAASETAAGAEARELICAMFCQTHTACGACPGCKRAARLDHPDILALQAEQRAYRIEEARAIPDFLSRRAYEGGYKCVYISQAHKMPPKVQNYLLKPIEEPMAGAVFLLSTSKPELLLATIHSRCALVRVRGEGEASVLAKLGREDAQARTAARLSSGYLAEAQAMLEDTALWEMREKAASIGKKMATAKSPSVFEAEQAILAAGNRTDEAVFALALALRDALVYKLTGEAGQLVGADTAEAAVQMSQSFTTGALRYMIEVVNDAYERIKRCPGLQIRLAVNGMLLRLLEVRAKWRKS